MRQNLACDINPHHLHPCVATPLAATVSCVLVVQHALHPCVPSDPNMVTNMHTLLLARITVSPFDTLPAFDACPRCATATYVSTPATPTPHNLFCDSSIPNSAYGRICLPCYWIGMPHITALMGTSLSPIRGHQKHLNLQPPTTRHAYQCAEQCCHGCPHSNAYAMLNAHDCLLAWHGANTLHLRMCALEHCGNDLLGSPSYARHGACLPRRLGECDERAERAEEDTIYHLRQRVAGCSCGGHVTPRGRGAGDDAAAREPRTRAEQYDGQQCMRRSPSLLSHLPRCAQDTITCLLYSIGTKEVERYTFTYPPRPHTR